MTKIGMTSSCTLGCDPEIFIQKDGRIVGAEKALPKEGLINTGYDSKVIIDGVQAELNPCASTCRGSVGAYISTCLRELKTALDQKGMGVCTDGTIQIDEEELKSLDEKNQRLGCDPSNNLYKTKATVSVNKKNKLTRSAGGHIHLSIVEPEPKILVPILDLLVGNTCVLIDRDPNQAIRRKQYGRAGEYRLPTWGLEYRTPSNFWLRSYQLMGFVMGLCRLAVAITSKKTGSVFDYETGAYKPATPVQHIHQEAIDWLQKNTNQKAVRVAINKNNFGLAMKNWETTKEFIRNFTVKTGCPETSSYFLPLYPEILEAFEYFVEKGIDYWFPNKDIFDHWSKIDLGSGHKGSFRSHGDNWEGWFHSTVLPEWKKQKALKK